MRTKLYGKLAYRCKLLRPLPLLILHFTDGIYVAQDGITSNIECGPTKGEALTRYRRSLASDFLFLKQHESELSEPLKQELHTMKQFIARY